jgi:hypothetical protein
MSASDSAGKRWRTPRPPASSSPAVASATAAPPGEEGVAVEGDEGAAARQRV